MGDEFDAFPAQARARSAAADDEPEAPESQQRDYRLPAAVVYTSKSEGVPHMVTVVDDPRGRRLQCVCRSAAIRGDCWATQDARQLFGWPEERTT